jgi:uncharacterized protein YkwD
MFPVRSLAGFGLALWAVLWLCGTPPAPAARDRASELLQLVNEERQSRHLLALVPSPELAEVARAHALELSRSGALSHINRARQSPLDRVRAAGISGFSLLAENLGKTDVRGNRLEAIVAGWRASTVHRENLLNPAFNTTGVAVLDAAGGQTLVVQLYATF